MKLLQFVIVAANATLLLSGGMPVAHADGVSLKASKIDLAQVEKKLRLNNRQPFSEGVFSYSFSIPDTKNDIIARFEAWGYFPGDLNKIVVGCHRFYSDGSGPKPEDISTPCGKVYADILSVFVNEPVDFANSLMVCARSKGKQYSTCTTQLGDITFEYGNDSILIVRRNSRSNIPP